MFAPPTDVAVMPSRLGGDLLYVAHRCDRRRTRRAGVRGRARVLGGGWGPSRPSRLFPLGLQDLPRPAPTRH